MDNDRSCRLREFSEKLRKEECWAKKITDEQLYLLFLCCENDLNAVQEKVKSVSDMNFTYSNHNVLSNSILLRQYGVLDYITQQKKAAMKH